MRITQLLKSQSTFNTQKRNYFTTHLKPGPMVVDF